MNVQKLMPKTLKISKVKNTSPNLVTLEIPLRDSIQLGHS